jgi:hypothetical protein
MVAIALAGGSIAACSDGAELPGGRLEQTGGAAPDASAAHAPNNINPARVAPEKFPILTGYAVPACNANPDPCCRLPGWPGCGADAGGDGAGESLPE